MIRSTPVRLEIPIFAIGMALDMPIQKIKVRSRSVNVCVNVVLLRACRTLAVVEKVDHARRIWHRAQTYRPIVRACPIYMFVHAVMKQIIPVATVCVGGTNPDGFAEWSARVSMPRHVKIVPNPKLLWNRHVPTCLRIKAGSRSFSRKVIVIVGSVELHSPAPLKQIV